MYRFYVTESRLLTATTLLLTIKKGPSEKPFSFQPGQYATISFTVNGRPTPARNFSIVNSPTEQGILQFSIRVKGRFTNALTNLKVDDEVKVQGPFGAFVFDSNRDDETIMLAGGIGIAPFMSMIRFASMTNLNNKLKLIYNNRNQIDVPFVDEIKDYANSNPNFQPTFLVGEGPSDNFAGCNVKNGRITPEVVDQVVKNNYADKVFFICGPPNFMNGMTEILRNKGVSGEDIITEAFSQNSKRQTSRIFSWPMNVYALSAVGLSVTSAAVMVSDLIKTLPPAATLSSSNIANPLGFANSRQNDLDELVNGLPSVDTKDPVTDAVRADVAKKAAALTASKNASNVNTNFTTIATPSPTPSSPAPTPAPASATVYKPVPVCTTSQSGVTTCV